MYQRQPRADHKRSGRRPLWNLSATGASRPVPSRQETAIIAPLPRQGPYPAGGSTNDESPHEPGGRRVLIAPADWRCCERRAGIVLFRKNRAPTFVPPG